MQRPCPWRGRRAGLAALPSGYANALLVLRHPRSHVRMPGMIGAVQTHQSPWHAATLSVINNENSSDYGDLWRHPVSSGGVARRRDVASMSQGTAPMPFTDARIEAVKPVGRPHRLFDGSRLFLSDQPSGRKTFRIGLGRVKAAWCKGQTPWQARRCSDPSRRHLPRRSSKRDSGGTSRPGLWRSARATARPPPRPRS